MFSSVTKNNRRHDSTTGLTNVDTQQENPISRCDDCNHERHEVADNFYLSGEYMILELLTNWSLLAMTREYYKAHYERLVTRL